MINLPLDKGETHYLSMVIEQWLEDNGDLPIDRKWIGYAKVRTVLNRLNRLIRKEEAKDVSQ